MRSDFNKLLVERERPRSWDKHCNYRHMKGPSGFKDDEVGGREGMKHHYKIGYDTKDFNENLNPLYGWLRSIVGKKWDKSYSELCKTFDMRGVINAHILQHLWQSVERHAFVSEKGAVMAFRGYSSGGRETMHGDAVPISRCGKDYYICPKDGTLKKTQKAPRRSVVKEQEANKRKELLAIKRPLNDREVLHFIDGVWYHFELKPLPEAKIVYMKPGNKDEFRVGYHYGNSPDHRKVRTWDELNQTERERLGTPKVVGGTARDLLTNEVVYRDQKGVIHLGKGFLHPRRANELSSNGLYHATKKTASKKHLKQAGLID